MILSLQHRGEPEIKSYEELEPFWRFSLPPQFHSSKGEDGTTAARRRKWNLK